ncbi:MAG TPA: Flp pilus assembly protein CpaB [Azospirillaceae bacterium]|nr:Flp pilus assembly protein CpaB [Azospirillaceae bacterium]
MQKRRLALFAAAAIVALATFQLASRVGTPAPIIVQAPAAAPAVPAPRMARVLVAAADLPAGLLIQPENLAWRTWPEEGVDDAYLTEGEAKPQDFAGAVVRTGIRAGEPVFAGRLVRPGERGFLAAVLNPEMRAVTVPINVVTGIAGFVFPGDRVDVILTHGVVRPDDPSMKERRASETVLTDVRVVALDQRTNDQEAKPTVSQTATLEVTPRQAEWLPLAVELGRLSLSLRSLSRDDAKMPPADDGAPALVRAALAARSGAPVPQKPAPRTHSWDSDVSAVLPDPSRVRRVQVIRGSKAEDISFAPRN